MFLFIFTWWGQMVSKFVHILTRHHGIPGRSLVRRFCYITTALCAFPDLTHYDAAMNDIHLEYSLHFGVVLSGCQCILECIQETVFPTLLAISSPVILHSAFWKVSLPPISGTKGIYVS